jgi:hypothetical protein
MTGTGGLRFLEYFTVNIRNRDREEIGTSAAVSER